MHLTIKTGYLIQLRQIVMGAGGESVLFMRVQPIAHATKMKVWICVLQPIADLIMEAVLRVLPCAEFGHFAAIKASPEQL